MTAFEQEFLEKYLNFGLGSMPKSDIDALVMHLLDQHGYSGSPPLSQYSNQSVSELLRTPVSKVKRLRYDAALKFGGRVEDQAQARLLAALSRASLEPEGDKVCLIIEDTLAKNWLQGQLKKSQQIFEHSFNTEIVKVSARGLFDVLEAFFDKKAIADFRKGYELTLAKKSQAAIKREFKQLVINFAHTAAKKAGAEVVALFKQQIMPGL